MRDNRAVLTVEGLLYAVVLGAGAWLRLSGLGRLPLSDAEAAEALGALGVGPGSALAEGVGGQAIVLAPAYALPTNLLFQVLGPSDGLARLVPALAGILLLLTPFALRNALGRGAALAATFALAISPTLVTVSRTAGGPALAVSALALAAAFAISSPGTQPSPHRLTLAAICAAIALASGPVVYSGVLSLIIAVAALVLTKVIDVRWAAEPSSRPMVRHALLVGVAVLLAVTSGLGLALEGFSAVFEALASWVGGWARWEGFPALTAVALLPIYDPWVALQGLGYGIWILGTRKREPIETGSIIWAAASLLLVLIYPARQPELLAWEVVPLAILAGRLVAWLIERVLRWDPWWPAAVLVGVLLTLAAFAYLQLGASLQETGIPGVAPGANLRIYVVVLVALMSVVMVIIFGAGWSWELGVGTGLSALTLVMLVTSLSSAWRLNFPVQGAGAQELWRPHATAEGMRLLASTITRFSEAETGRGDTMPVDIRGQAPAALAWYVQGLRGPSLSASATAGIARLELVQEELVPPERASTHMGQSFAIRESWGWSGALPPDMLRWWLTRTAEVARENWLLLVPAGAAGVLSSPE